MSSTGCVQPITKSQHADAKEILERSETHLSPWVRVVSKAVRLEPGRRIEVYHCLSQSDSVAILARTQSGLIPIVRQYRPAVEAYTWELPSGLLQEKETPGEACRRELKEETGLKAKRVRYIGSYYADTGRLEHWLHAFYVSASNPGSDFAPEPGLTVSFVSPRELRQHIRLGRFQYLHHIGVLTLASLKGIRWDG